MLCFSIESGSSVLLESTKSRTFVNAVKGDENESKNFGVDAGSRLRRGALDQRRGRVVLQRW